MGGQCVRSVWESEVTIDKGKALYGLINGFLCQYGHTVRFMSTDRCVVCYRFGLDENYRKLGDRRFKPPLRTQVDAR